MRLRALAWVAAALLGGGCVTQRAQLPPADSAALSAVAESFSLRGKMGVRTASDGHSARLIWHQRANTFDIELSGPVGIGRTTLAGTPRRVTIADRDGSRTYNNPARALQAELGWSPPLSALRYWAVGLPAPNQAYKSLPAASGERLARFVQAGWTVEVGQLADYGQWTLPRKLTLTRGDTRLRLIATDWQVPASTD